MLATKQALAAATQRLAEAGVDSPRVDAEILLAHVLGVTRSGLLTRDDIDAADAATFTALVARRADREPLQHIVGMAPFRHLVLEVGPGVFIPRPETELLVDAVLPTLRSLARPLVVDLCAGSGAIGLAIADEAPHARVAAVERSERAIAWLRRNIERTGARGAGFAVVDEDVTDPNLLLDMRGRVDVVVSNPPYVPTSAPIEPEVRADPEQAIFAGSDGLGMIPDVIARAAELLRSGGVVAIEHDDSHGTAVPELLDRDGRWERIKTHPDLAGRARFATAARR